MERIVGRFLLHLFILGILVGCSAVDRKGNYLIGEDKKFQQTTSLLYRTEVHSDNVTDMNFSIDGEFIVTASRDGTVRLWHALSGKLYREFSVKQASPICAALCPDNDVLAVSFDSKTVHVWDVKNGLKKSKLSHSKRVGPLTFFGNSSKLITGLIEFPGNDARSVNVWDVNSGAMLKSLKIEVPCYDIETISGTKLIAVALDDSSCEIYDLKNNEPVLVENETNRRSLGVSVRQSRVAIASNDPGHLRQLIEGAAIRTRLVVKGFSENRVFMSISIEGQAAEPSLNFDGTLVAMVVLHRGDFPTKTAVVVWEVSTGKEVLRIPSNVYVAENDLLARVSFHPMLPILAISSKNGELMLLKME